jgi:adenosylhomocysteinase
LGHEWRLSISVEFLGHIKDLHMASAGVDRIEWAAREMPVLHLLKERFSREKPLTGVRISGCLHITSETANLALVLQAGGASVVLCASNPLSTQDEVAAALVKEYGIPTYAIRGESDTTYYEHIRSALGVSPQITMDDGADLVAMLHRKERQFLNGVLGGTEETTTGVNRLRSMSRAGELNYPIVAVNEANTKHLFDNRYGTGQSTIDGITRATNILWAGRWVVVVGYGWCGKGIAMRARGLGANVIVTEIDPIRALEATMDGYSVMTMAEAAPIGGVFITATGGLNAVDGKHLEVMKNGAILANSGHFNVEINIPALEKLAIAKRLVRGLVDEYTMSGNRRIFLLAQGRLVNLSAAEGHPSSVMDMSFANQALSVEYLVTNSTKLVPEVYTVPYDIDAQVGMLKLRAMGIKIDVLSKEQKTYIDGWETGT